MHYDHMARRPVPHPKRPASVRFVGLCSAMRHHACVCTGANKKQNGHDVPRSSHQAPECFDSDVGHISNATDIYSFGIILVGLSSAA